MERMTGPDAVMLHLERPTVPMHTLKIVVLDSLERGRPITLPELRGAVTPYLGLVPRATQKIVSVTASGGRPTGLTTGTSTSTATSTRRPWPRRPGRRSTRCAPGWPSATSTDGCRCGR